MENMRNPDIVSYFILSAIRALLCEVRINMRQVSIEYRKEEKRFILYLFYDQPLTQQEEDYDVPGTITVEIGCDFPDPDVVLNWEDQIIVVPYPTQIPQKGICIFRRYEPGLKQDELAKFKPQMRSSPDLEDNGDLIISANRALQGEVRPNMRKVSVEYIKEEKKCILYLFYDKPLSEEEKYDDVAGRIMTKLRRDFPEAQDVIWEHQISVIPYPDRIPQQMFCIYRRYEATPKEHEGDPNW